jgi:hypothetical protein
LEENSIVKEDVQQGTRIGIDTDRYSRRAEPVDGVIGIGFRDIRLHVAAWAHYAAFRTGFSELALGQNDCETQKR